MTTRGFVATHAKDAKIQRGLRSFFVYRDLGISGTTEGRVDAHVIRAAEGKTSIRLRRVVAGTRARARLLTLDIERSG